MTNQPVLYHSLSELGEVADAFASATVFETCRMALALNTRLKHRHDLNLFAVYLAEKHVAVGDFYDDPQAWRGVTWGLVSGFLKWMLKRGDAIGSINTRLTTVRKYSELAFAAGVISEKQYALIRTVHGIRGKAAINVDADRTVKRLGTRKEHAPSLSNTDRRRLKHEHAENEQGARDELLMCLLLDHGLRVGEVVALKVSDVNVDTGIMHFYREKVNMSVTHILTKDTLDALKHYQARGLMLDDPAEILMVKSFKGGKAATNHVSRRGLGQRVRTLGKRILQLPNLAPHDCRHSWATEYARNHTEFELQEAGGWSSLAMPRRYVERAKISHDGKAMD